MKKKTIISSAIALFLLFIIFGHNTNNVESIKISFPNYQAEYDINTDIPVTVTIFPSDAVSGHIEYNTDSSNITFSKDGIHTGSQEGTYSFYVSTGDIQSNTLTITVVDMETRTNTIHSETELAASKPFEEAQPQEEPLSVLDNEQTHQNSKTDVQIESSTDVNPPNSIEMTDAEKSTEPAIPVESVPLDNSQIISDTTITTQFDASPTDADSNIRTGNDSNFNTYNNAEQQSTTDEYVLNTNTLKIHHPSCSSVPKIAPQNYATSNLSITELEAQGYSTCGNCFR